MANIKYSPQVTDLIVQSLVKGDSVTNACKIAGIGTTAFYTWIADPKKPEFKDAVQKAEEVAKQNVINQLKHSLFQRAIGYDTEEVTTELATNKEGKVYIKSKKQVQKHVAPDTAALIFALSNLDPENWKNTQRTEITGKDGKDFRTTEIDLDALTPEQKSTLVELGENVIKKRLGENLTNEPRQ